MVLTLVIRARFSVTSQSGRIELIFTRFESRKQNYFTVQIHLTRWEVLLRWLMFSSLHSYKPITGPSHVPLTVHSGVLSFPGLISSGSMLPPLKPAGEMLHTPCFNGSELIQSLGATTKTKELKWLVDWQKMTCHNLGNLSFVVVNVMSLGFSVSVGLYKLFQCIKFPSGRSLCSFFPHFWYRPDNELINNNHNNLFYIKFPSPEVIISKKSQLCVCLSRYSRERLPFCSSSVCRNDRTHSWLFHSVSSLFWFTSSSAFVKSCDSDSRRWMWITGAPQTAAL